MNIPLNVLAKAKRFFLSAWIISLVTTAIILQSGFVHALSLTNWNVTELNLTDDYVNVVIGEYSGDTTLTVQWGSVVNDSPGAIGIDMFLYNCVGCGPFTTQNDDETGDPGAVIAVWSGSIGGTDVSGEWDQLNFNGLEGDGFGVFASRTNKDAGGTYGITDPLIFVLNGITTFTTNGNIKPDDTKEPGTFAAHVRYRNDCSGWVSDGNAGSSIESDSSCAAVPEPSTLLLLGSGLVGLGLMRRKLNIKS